MSTIETSSGVTYITLGSCTVFASELPRIQSDDDLHEAEAWLRENISRPWRIWRDGVWFCYKQDAMLFKLTWGGDA